MTHPSFRVIDDLLDEDMCERLIAKAEPHLRQSMVQTEEGYIPNPSRTSCVTSLELLCWPTPRPIAETDIVTLAGSTRLSTGARGAVNTSPLL